MKTGTIYAPAVTVVGTNFNRANCDWYDQLHSIGLGHIKIVPDPYNPYDPNAIKVMGYDEDAVQHAQLGFIPAALAARINAEQKAGTLPTNLQVGTKTFATSPKKGDYMEIVIDIINPRAVSLSPNRYAELISAEDKLHALEANGVDNWDGYDDAMTYASNLSEGESK